MTNNVRNPNYESVLSLCIKMLGQHFPSREESVMGLNSCIFHCSYISGPSCVLILMDHNAY